MNPFCQAHLSQWRCNFCRVWNELEVPDHSLRLAESMEVQHHFLELKRTEKTHTLNRIVNVVILDTRADSHVFETMKSGLLHAVSTMPLGTWLSLVIVRHEKVGLYDLRCAIPSVFYTSVLSEGSKAMGETSKDMGRLSYKWSCGTAVPLANLVNGIENVSVQISEQNRGSIVAAIQSVQVCKRKRNFSSLHHAIGSVFEAMAPSTLYQKVVYGANIILLSSGTSSADKIEQADVASFELMGEVGVLNGTSLNLLLFGSMSESCLESKCLARIVNQTGGVCVCDAGASAILVKLMSGENVAFACEISIATSEGFAVSVSEKSVPFGSALRKTNSWVVAKCDPRTSFAVDFEYLSADGISDYEARTAYVQTTFSYSTFSIRTASVEHYVRVYTASFHSSRDLVAMYTSACTGTVFSIMSRKLIQASVLQGVDETKELMSDWVVFLSSQINKAAAQNMRGRRKKCYFFDEKDYLWCIPRLLFGLLHSPVFEPATEGNLIAALRIHVNQRSTNEAISAVFPTPELFQDEQKMFLYFQWYEEWLVTIRKAANEFAATSD